MWFINEFITSFDVLVLSIKITNRKLSIKKKLSTSLEVKFSYVELSLIIFILFFYF